MQNAEVAVRSGVKYILFMEEMIGSTNLSTNIWNLKPQGPLTLIWMVNFLQSEKRKRRYLKKTARVAIPAYYGSSNIKWIGLLDLIRTGYGYSCSERMLAYSSPIYMTVSSYSMKDMLKVHGPHKPVWVKNWKSWRIYVRSQFWMISYDRIYGDFDISVLCTCWHRPGRCRNQIIHRNRLDGKHNQIAWHKAPDSNDLWVLPNGNILFTTGHGTENDPSEWYSNLPLRV